MSQIKELKLIYENCEVLTVPNNCIQSTLFKDYEIVILGVGDYKTMNEVFNKILLVINPNINQVEQPGLFYFKGEKKEKNTDFLYNRHDITQIEVLFEDESKNFTALVNWDEEGDDYCNQNHKNELIDDFVLIQIQEGEDDKDVKEMKKMFYDKDERTYL